MAERKYIRIALTPEDEKAFLAKKKKAEDETGISMTDAQFVLSVLRHKIRD